MTLKEILWLARRERVSYKTRSFATIVTIGILFGLLFGVLFVLQGLENLTLRYAGAATDGEVYLASQYQQEEIVKERIEEYSGEIIDLESEQLQGHLSDAAIVAKWSSLKDAARYMEKSDADKWHYEKNEYQIFELFGDQVEVMNFYRRLRHDFAGPAMIVLLIIAIVILAFTMAHLMANDAKSFVFYRALGASRSQVLLIYLVFLLELCFWAAVFALAVGLVLAGVATMASGKYLTAQLVSRFASEVTFLPILFGWDWLIVAVLGVMLMAAPLAFVLCLDQFSDKKIAQKLKGD